MDLSKISYRNKLYNLLYWDFKSVQVCPILNTYSVVIYITIFNEETGAKQRATYHGKRGSYIPTSEVIWT